MPLRLAEALPTNARHTHVLARCSIRPRHKPRRRGRRFGLVGVAKKNESAWPSHRRPFPSPSLALTRRPGLRFEASAGHERRLCRARARQPAYGRRAWGPGWLGLAARVADARRARASQDGFVDWSQVRADDLELPEDDDLGVHTCVPGNSPCRLTLAVRAAARRTRLTRPPPLRCCEPATTSSTWRSRRWRPALPTSSLCTTCLWCRPRSSRNW